MIVGLWHAGSGLGDQLFCYLAARITAERLHVPFTMVGEFKGESFMKLDKGIKAQIPHHIEYPAGKIVIDSDFPLFEGKRWYDPEFNFIEDNTIVDGCMMQDKRYWESYWDCVPHWLQVERLEVPDDVVVIGFRGGEYALFPELFLTKDYWKEAIAMFPDKRIEIHTDDGRLAADYFADLLPPQQIRVFHEIGFNWRSVRYAKNLIVANSAFYILSSLLNQNAEKIVAPYGWSRRNLGKGNWEMPCNYYPRFTYI